jgi:hypothetical protein
MEKNWEQRGRKTPTNLSNSTSKAVGIISTAICKREVPSFCITASFDSIEDSMN